MATSAHDLSGKTVPLVEGLMSGYIRVVDRLNRGIGRVVMYGIFVIMAILLWSMISKFSDQPSLWTLDMAQFAMIAYVVLGGPYSIQLGANVRMDLFYERWSLRQKAWVDAFTVLCMIVYLAVLFHGAVASFAYSLGYFGAEPYGFLLGLMMGEADTGHLERGRTAFRPYLWPIKAMLCLGMLLMLMQAIAELCRDLLLISNGQRR
ncbi:TRAP transporter small permease subunit [Gammaproteobacteria bacterium]|nr:TRAP transporter small permease subunit [Gammaproteobacteria bacterium]